MSGLADQFSDKQITEFKEAFSLFDDNKDGTVFMAQIDFVMKALGIHGNEMELRVGILCSIICARTFLRKIRTFFRNQRFLDYLNNKVGVIFENVV